MTGEKQAMSEAKRFFGKMLVTETRGVCTVSIYQRKSGEIDPERVIQLKESGLQALEVAQEISSDLIKSLSLFVGEDVSAYIHINGRVSNSMLHDDSDSQVGALLHELIESLEEDEGFELGNKEGLPNLAEFLFTGNDRLDYFQFLTEKALSGEEVYSYLKPYVSSWPEVVRILCNESNIKDPAELFSILESKRALSREQKIQIIREVLDKTREQHRQKKLAVTQEN